MIYEITTVMTTHTGRLATQETPLLSDRLLQEVTPSLRVLLRNSVASLHTVCAAHTHEYSQTSGEILIQFLGHFSGRKLKCDLRQEITSFTTIRLLRLRSDSALWATVLLPLYANFIF